MENEDREVAPELILMATALAEGRTHAEVAELCGVSTKTVQRRLQDTALSRLVQQARVQRVEQLTGQLLSLTDRSLDVIAETLTEEQPHIRLQGARAVLDYGRRYYRELRDRELEERMAALEARVAPSPEADASSAPAEYR